MLPCICHFFLKCLLDDVADLSELDLPKGASIRFPLGDDKIMNFELILKPDEGMYEGGAFLFSFNVPIAYPHEPPKVKCLTKVFHPNIDLDGNICLNILREDWKPVLTISSLVFGLNFLFIVSRIQSCLFSECLNCMGIPPPRSHGFSSNIFKIITVYSYSHFNKYLPYYFQAPNGEDPLNKEAADMMNKQESTFRQKVAASVIRGSTINGQYFPPARAQNDR